MNTTSIKSTLRLCVHSRASGFHAITEDQLNWDIVSNAIDNIFAEGGTVQLMTENKTCEPTPGLIQQDSIEINAIPNKYRITVSPFKKHGERSNQREWWNPKTENFQGNETFIDNECDIRTICTEPQIAKTLFLEFFVNRGITTEIINATLSVWEPKTQE